MFFGLPYTTISRQKPQLISTMAENNPPIVSRSKLLSNNAAEFAETQAGKYFGPEFSQPNGAEFDPDADMFVDQDAVSPLQYVRVWMRIQL